MSKGTLIIDRLTPNKGASPTFTRSTENIIVTVEEAAEAAREAILHNPTNDSLQITFTPER